MPAVSAKHLMLKKKKKKKKSGHCSAKGGKIWGFGVSGNTSQVWVLFSHSLLIFIRLKKGDFSYLYLLELLNFRSNTLDV